MNKSSIEWCDYTWNPIWGCLNNCDYCYARKIGIRFKGHFNPTFYPERLGQPLENKNPSRIFVGSMTDIMGDFIPEGWINEVLDVVKKAHWHTFLFLTKNPSRYYMFDFPDNCWLGTTLTGGEDDYSRIDNLLDHDSGICNHIIFVSVEPFLSPFIYYPFEGIDWIIVGAQTGNKPKQPEVEWLEGLDQFCRHHKIPMFYKNNITAVRDKSREFPLTSNLY
jgi:protein gp37